MAEIEEAAGVPEPTPTPAPSPEPTPPPAPEKDETPAWARTLTEQNARILEALEKQNAPKEEENPAGDSAPLVVETPPLPVVEEAKKRKKSKSVPGRRLSLGRRS